MSTGKEIVFEIWRASERRCYFLMSSAGAGIGYSLAVVDTALDPASTRWLLAAIALWALSFFAGLSALNSFKAAMHLSRNVIELRGQFPDFQSGITEVISPEIASVGNRTARATKAQVTLLALGAITFLFVKIDVLSALGLSNP